MGQESRFSYLTKDVCSKVQKDFSYFIIMWYDCVCEGAFLSCRPLTCQRPFWLLHCVEGLNTIVFPYRLGRTWWAIRNILSYSFLIRNGKKIFLTFFSILIGDREEVQMVCAGKEFRLPVYSTSRTVTFTQNSAGPRRILLEKTIVREILCCVFCFVF